MKTSEQINELAVALIAFQSEIKSLVLNKIVKVKTLKGGEYSFKYATFENCKETAQPLLTKNNLAISQVVDEGGQVTTILMHKSGQYIAGTFGIDPVEKNPQSIGSAISYAKRYAFSSILGLIADEDDDANIAEDNQFHSQDHKLTPNGQKQSEEPEKPWMGKEERDKLLDWIMQGKYKEKTADQVIKLAEVRFKIRTDFRNDIKEAMDMSKVESNKLI